MDLSSESGVKNLLKKHNLRPSKGLGQNFLIDKAAVRKIITSVDLKPEDIALEIGPGLGVLTLELSKKVKRVIAIEKDPKMVEILKETLKDYENVEVIHGDVLKIENYELFKNCKLKAELCKSGTKRKKMAEPSSHIKNIYKIVADLPFYLTAPAIRKFLELESPPELMALIVQKEVAQRIIARPPRMNLLAVSVQFYAEPKIIAYISKNSFWPRPKVDAAIIKIVPRQFRVSVSRQFRERFFRIVKAGFSQPRKQLVNNLFKNLGGNKMKIEGWLLKNNIQPNQRAETLTAEGWINLVENYEFL